MQKGRDLQVLASQMDFLIVLEQHVLVLIDGGVKEIIKLIT